MKKNQMSEAEILSLLASQGKGKTVEELCREAGHIPGNLLPMEKQI